MSKVPQRKIPKTIKFDNFEIIDPYVIVDVHGIPFTDDNGEDNVSYHAFLALSFDDDFTKILMMETDIYDECSHCCAREAAFLARELYGTISNHINVYIDGEPTDQFKANELLEEDEQEDNNEGKEDQNDTFESAEVPLNKNQLH